MRRWLQLLLPLAFVTTILAIPASAPAATLEQELASALQVELDRQTDQRRGAGVEDSIWRSMREFYRKRDYRLVWSEGVQTRPLVVELLEAVREAEAAALDASDYGIERLTALAESPSHAGELAALDVHATEAFVRYGTHLARGRVEPTSVDATWRVIPRRADVWAALASVEAGEPLNQALFALEPRSNFYRDTKRAYANLRAVAKAGGWGTVQPGRTLQTGMRDARVEQVRNRLVAAGDMAKKARKGRTYDSYVEESVRDFQKRHQIEATGAVDSATLAMLNVPVEDRMRQLALNLERARWMADDPPGMGVYVNVPDFTLTVIDRDRTLLRSKVITGRFYHPTPVLNDSIVTVVSNPTWTVPQTIATIEILPAVQRDPTYLDRKNIRVFVREKRGLREIDRNSVNWTEVQASKFPYQFRQDAGPENPLGRVKFVLTNDQFIYLHDTPSAHLFNFADRTASYGCIRVEKPFELAHLALAESEAHAEWDALVAADSAHLGNETRSFAVRPSVPVRVTYWTAWAEVDGQTHWRSDPYRIDFLHDWALKNRYQPDPYAVAEGTREPSAGLENARREGGGSAAVSPQRRPSRR